MTVEVATEVDDEPSLARIVGLIRDVPDPPRPGVLSAM